MNITVKKRIMFGVYLLYLVRKLKTPLIAESFSFAILGVALVYFVSIPSFFSNMFQSGNFYDYFIIAFSNTDFLIQSILVLAAIMAFLFVRNITVHAILKTRSV